MENLEEVMQALDEFQKMRPTEIPPELDNYLSWVAKTGDPVYQWSMIKTLFREKLTRVMTDFYETSPTLELAPCPNVEHFNYDTMKSNLLDRLESFANAPFTVQRICELLTSPRKEYNRVDKFMRAIEKNILVVSTREPGPIARRGETGDGMVNGSVEEDTVTQQQQPPPPSPPPSSSPSQPAQTTQTAQPTTQPTSQDVEMEYWEKDCASTVTISVHTVENETPVLHTVVPGTTGTGALAKNTVFTVETAREKLEQAVSRMDHLTATNILNFPNLLTSQVEQSHEPPVPAVPAVQNLPTPVETIVAEDSAAGSTDVAEAIMNEDTNSQASLDMENEEVDPATTATTSAAVTIRITTTTTTATTATTTTTTGSTSPSTTSASTTSTSSSATTTVTVVATVIPLTTDTTRNLQAAFQAKRFEADDSKCSDKSNEKTTAAPAVDAESAGIVHSMKSGESTEQTNAECNDTSEMSREESGLTESLLKTDVDMRVADDVAEERIPSKPEPEEAAAEPRLADVVDEENSRCQDDEGTKATQMVFVESPNAEKDNASDECMSAVIVSPSNSEALQSSEKAEELQPKGTFATTIPPKDSRQLHEQSDSQRTDNIDVVTEQVLEPIPREASPKSDEQTEHEASNSELNGEDDDGVKMMEISDDKTALVEPMVLVEPTKMEKVRETAATVIEKLDSTVSPVVEMTDGSIADVDCPTAQDDALLRTAEDGLTSAGASVKDKQSSVIESAACRRESHDHQVEMMEVDDEETTSTFQQQQLDEQMEHETMEELSKS